LDYDAPAAHGSTSNNGYFEQRVLRTSRYFAQTGRQISINLSLQIFTSHRVRTVCERSICQRTIFNIRPQNMITSAQLEQYQRDGFLFIENALTEIQVDELQSATRRLILESADITESNDQYDLDAGHSAEQPRLTRIKLPHLLDPVFRQVMQSDQVTNLIKPLLNTEHVRLHTSKLNTKEPHGGQAVEWHQDWAFYPHTNDDLLAIGILLEDVEEENGPLMAIPGTHRGRCNKSR